jgi:cysteine-rich secretory family protein
MSWTRESKVGALILATKLVFVLPIQSSEMLSRIERHSQNLDWLVKHPTIQKLLELHNQERARNRLPPSTLDAKMCLAAQKHAVWMAETGWFQHSGLPYRENIFWGVRTPDDAINGWIWSPAHHGNMLTGSAVGFGYMIIDGRPYWCAVMQ